jgi:hypothetical protein
METALADAGSSAPLPSPEPLRVQVVGADAAPVPTSDLARLFPRLRPFSPRFDRLAQSARVEVSDGERLVGLAIYLRAEDELRVPELAVNAGPNDGARGVLNTIFDALETACLAGGHRRLIVTPPPNALAMLQRRGYALVREGCAGTWLEKTFD